MFLCAKDQSVPARAKTGRTQKPICKTTRLRGLRSGPVWKGFNRTLGLQGRFNTTGRIACLQNMRNNKARLDRISYRYGIRRWVGCQSLDVENRRRSLYSVETCDHLSIVLDIGSK